MLFILTGLTDYLPPAIPKVTEESYTILKIDNSIILI